MKTKQRKYISFSWLITPAVLLLPITLVQAATINVNTTSDEYDGGGNCSVREAIDRIYLGSDGAGCTNTGDAYGSNDTVNLQSGATYVLTAGTLVIERDVTINGNSATVSSSVSSRVFHLCPSGGCPSAVVTINHLNISNGLSSGPGGGIYVNMSANLYLNASTVSDNRSSYRGAGIYISTGGSATITDSAISNNTVTGTSNGYGGGISTHGDLFIINSEISGNISQDAIGGGIFIGPTGRVWLTDSTVSGNQAPASAGGGIFNGSGELTIIGSTISGNSANSSASGIQQQGTATITNSTISGNMGGSGIGIWASGVSTSFSNVTIANNTGTGYRHFQTATFQNTIIANNGPDCVGTGGETFTSNANNLDSDNTCTFTHVNDLPNTDPLLGPLQDNGGPTHTHALTSSSPAIDAGNASACTWDHDADIGTAQVALIKDQRGMTRPQDGDNNGTVRCDIGAYEVPTADIKVSDASAPIDDHIIDFGDIEIGTSSSLVIVTLANEGDLTLIVSNVQITGTDAGDFSIDLSAGSKPCGVLAIPITGGQSCTLGLTFSPQSTGSKTVSLVIASDDIDEDTVSIALSGTGFIPLTPPPPPTAGGGGGGCTARMHSPFDPLLPLLMLVAVIYLWHGKRQNSVYVKIE